MNEDAIDMFHAFLMELFYEQYPQQLAEDNPQEYTEQLNQFLDDYGYVVHN